MKAKLKKILETSIFKDSLVYGLTNVLYTGLPIILMPFLITFLDPEDYGKIELFRSITMVLTPILGLSTIQSISRFYFDLNEVDFKKFTSSIIILHIFNALIAFILIYGLSFFIPHDYIVFSILAVLFFVFNQTTEALLSVFRVNKLSKNYFIIRVGIVILDLSFLTILYYSLTNYDWTYRVLPNLIATVIFGIISVIIFWHKFGVKFQFDKELLKTAIQYSAPLIIHMISGYVLNIGDRFFITYYLGASELGNYSVAYQIGMIVSFFYTSFNLAWTPTYFEWMKQEKYSAIRKVQIITYILLPILGVISVILWAILSRFIPTLSGYDVNIELVIIITLSYVILSYYKFNSNYFFYYKKTKTLASITFFTGVVCTILYIVLIPRMGVMGAAFATMITFIIMFISTYLFKPNEKNIQKN